jgi:hypothetical protein
MSERISSLRFSSILDSDFTREALITECNNAFRAAALSSGVTWLQSGSFSGQRHGQALSIDETMLCRWC